MGVELGSQCKHTYPSKREQREGTHTLTVTHIFSHAHTHMHTHAHTLEKMTRRGSQERFEDARLGDWGAVNQSRNATNSRKLKEAEMFSPPPTPAPPQELAQQKGPCRHLGVSPGT